MIIGAYSILRLKWSDIQNEQLVYAMGKNLKYDYLKIPQQAQSILEKYKAEMKSGSDYIFPELKKVNPDDFEDIHRKIIIANKKFNNNLKRIAEDLKINENLSMHIALHSFGNIAGDRISPIMLQKLYRHSELSTTIGYRSNIIHKDTDEALGTV